MMKKRSTHLYFCRRGFNLIEAAIVLGVAGLVIGAIWNATINVYDYFNTTKTVSGIIMIKTNIQQAISRTDACQIGDIDITSQAINMNIFPIDWVKSNTIITPISAQGTSLQIANRCTSGERFDIVLRTKDRASCLRLLKAIPQEPSQSWATGVGNGSIVFIWTNYWSSSSFPIMIPSSACGTGSNPVILTYGYIRTN